MKHMLLACSALFLVPFLSGCCGCGSYVDPCSSNPCGANYGGCLQTATSSRVNYGTSGGCSSCQGGDENFSLPPETSSGQPYSAMPAYGQPIYGQPTYGPEVVEQQYVPGDGQWAPQVAPAVPGSTGPVTPAAPNYGNSSNVLMPATPIPPISNGSNVIPSPSAYPPAGQPGVGAGPMVPMVPPPPPEPITQMRFRQYR